MAVNEPNWTYRDLLNCTLAEVEGHVLWAGNTRQHDEAVAKAWGAVGLWLRLTDESRNPEDLKLLMARISSVSSAPGLLSRNDKV